MTYGRVLAKLTAPGAAGPPSVEASFARNVLVSNVRQTLPLRISSAKNPITFNVSGEEIVIPSPQNERAVRWTGPSNPPGQ